VSRRSPKPLYGVRLLAILLIADVAEQRGAGFVNRLMLVQVQSSALGVKTGPDGVTERIRTSEARGPGSSPGRDTACPASVMEAWQSSKLSDEVRLLGGVLVFCSRSVPDFAREPAKLEDQVQFLARTLEEFDAGARRHGNRLGHRRAAVVYGRSGFGSRRRL
jgi:hypothetical protein